MKHAYLIVAHQYPEQLVRLVDRLQSPDARFYIHIDKKVEHMMDDPHIKKLQNCYNVLIYSVLKTYWGVHSGSHNTIPAARGAQGQ